MTIRELELEIVDEFSIYENWMEKYEYIIELGKDLPLIQDEFKTDNYIIKGCQSRVWVHANYIDGKVFFTADSDAIITKGIIALLIKVLSNQSPEDILSAKLNFIDQIGLTSHLSPTRANGLLGMVKQIKNFAMVYKLKENS
ncbi:MAG: Fe-S metabolism protein SufE [Crocinitomicaceae bacterium]|nr:Fe-S metabolism protein SufE [Crocinitomicaceae bacterium]|tara:strand:- start:2942 stop:3367 length:426 start_codon:yes stop_codon:yes gene_type:complete